MAMGASYEVKGDRITFDTGVRNQSPLIWKFKISGEWMTVTYLSWAGDTSNSAFATFHRIKTLKQFQLEQGTGPGR
jgi:hypothetical protein